MLSKFYDDYLLEHQQACFIWPQPSPSYCRTLKLPYYWIRAGHLNRYAWASCPCSPQISQDTVCSGPQCAAKQRLMQYSSSSSVQERGKLGITFINAYDFYYIKIRAIHPAFLLLPHIMGKLNIQSPIYHLFLLLLDSKRWNQKFSSFDHA